MNRSGGHSRHESVVAPEFQFQPSVDQRLVRELATGHFIAGAENVLLFGPPGVGKTHLAIGLGRAVVEAGHSVLFITATSLRTGPPSSPGMSPQTAPLPAAMSLTAQKFLSAGALLKSLEPS